MSTHRRIGIVCVVCMALALVACAVVYAMGMGQGEASGHSMDYESTLFDTSKVHTIDIVMDDWDNFIENCEDEEYVPCAVVVDGESFKNVAIRAKGNTSLSNVKELGSDRYSLKIEFDQYEAGTNYHGLDKLSLNNLIQDDTMLKDYLTYRMMGEFGVDSPLASYAYVTVNGEDRGLFLAVEGVEDSFLERNYGNDKGELYKPDSMGFGGGRGNGREFDIQDVLSEQEGSDEDASGDNGGDAGSTGEAGGDAGGNAGANGFQPGSMPPSFSFDKDAGGAGSETGSDAGGGPSGGFGRGFGGGFGGMSSSDVKLQYIDDDPDSYPNIFDNAKTDITNADKVRLIASLRKLSAGEDLESVLDMDEVLRYFVVHDFVCNGDSYTGTMVHNYYLRENDGQLSMIPWDYNLAFGGFSGGDATSLVNSPIDSPVSSGFGGFGQGRSSDGDDSSNQTVSNENVADAGQQGEGDNAAQSPQGSQESQTMPQFPGGGDMSQAPSGGDMPQMLSGGDMPQMPSGVDMPQMSGGGNMQQALGGGQMPEFPGGGDTSQSSSDGSMPQAPGGGQMPEFSGSGDGSAPQFPGGGSMPQQPDGNQMPTSADGSTSFSPMEMFSSSASSDSRPMVDWIFSDEKYTERYHELYEEFLNSVDIQAIIDEAEALIDPYVERDPTKFCTTDEFHEAVDTLKKFCALRSQSVQGQLDGTIPSTEEGQQEDSSALVDASTIDVTTMGSMNAGGGGGFGGMKPAAGDQESNDSGQSDNTGRPDGAGQPDNGGQSSDGGRPDNAQRPGDTQQTDDSQSRSKPPFDMAAMQSSSSLVDKLPILAACVVAIAAGIAVTFVFRRP